MPEKEWQIPLGEFALLIRRSTRHGVLTEFAVVLVAFMAGRWTDITRYDTAHGVAHRDILGQKEGLRGKLLLPNMAFEEAFDYGIRDLKKNAEIYLADFLCH